MFCSASYAVLWWSAVVCGGLRFSDLPLACAVTVVITVVTGQLADVAGI